MKMHRLIHSIVLLVFWWIPTLCLANVVVVPDAGSIPIGDQVEFLEDPEGTLSIDQLLAGQVTQVESDGVIHTWKKADSEIPNFGYSTSIFWGKVTLDFSKAMPGKRWLLENDWPHVDNLTIVLANMDGVELDRQTAGLAVPYSQRKFHHRNIVYPL